MQELWHMVPVISVFFPSQNFLINLAAVVQLWGNIKLEISIKADLAQLINY